MHPLEKLLLEKLTSGLSRKAVAKCSQWALTYRTMGEPFSGPFTFDHHPWTRAMHDSQAAVNVGQKAAQVGFTETVLNWVLYNIDMKGLDCLYLLPNWKPDATDFSASRFGAAIELSPHLGRLFSDVRNVGHKRAGTANLYVRGTNSAANVKSIPAAILVKDELDEMNQDNAKLANERQSGQMVQLSWVLSTPTIPDFGINKEYELSSQQHFFFKCPHCGRFTELVPDCLYVTSDSLIDPKLKDSHIRCKECAAPLEHQHKREWLRTGEWVRAHEDRDSEGWYINQLYSPTVTPYRLAQKVLRARVDVGEEQHLYNSSWGLPYVPQGGQITDTDLNACQKPLYKSMDRYDGSNIVTMGIDVNFPLIHVEIDEWRLPPYGTPVVDVNQVSKCRVLAAVMISEPDGMTKLINLFKRFRVTFAVIDALPERRWALSFANSLYGRVRLCSYEQGVEGKNIQPAKDEPRVRVDRTSWLDMSLGRFKSSTIGLPGDISEVYRSHVKAQVRVYKEDRRGNRIGLYVTPSGQDHFGHARNYAEIALPLACQIYAIQDIKAPVF